MLSLIEQSIIISFFLWVIFSGIRNIGKIENVNVFAIGRRSFSVFSLWATISATWISGSSFFITLSGVYFEGLKYYIPSLGIVYCLLFIAFAITPFMKRFLGTTSVAEAMKLNYGEHARSITALAGFIGVSGSIAIQFKIFGQIGQSFFSISPNLALIIISGIVVFYTVFGGIQSVVKTDIIQLICFLISLPLVGIIFYYTLKQQTQINILEVEKFNITKFFHAKDFDLSSMICLALYFAIPGLQPTDFQRISMSFSTKQAKYSYLYSALFFLLIKIILLAFPLALFAIDQNLEKGQLLPYILQNFTSIPLLKAVLALGIISMAMSTADSMLNIGGILISNDFYFFKKRSDDKKLDNTRYCVLALGLMAIALTYLSDDLLSIILLSNSFYMPIVTVPLLLLIWGFKTTERCVLIAMGIAFSYVVIFKFILNSNLNIIPYAMALNALVLITYHYIIEKWELLKCFGIRSNLKELK